MRINTRGSILVLALWSLSLLSVFAVSLGYGVRQKLTLFARLEAIESLYSIAYSGIEKAKSVLKMDQDSEFDSLVDPWANNEAGFKQSQMVTGSFSVEYAAPNADNKETITWYGLIDEERKININLADTETLSRLLQAAAHLKQDHADEIAYCIVDWRDSDAFFQHPDYGAEDSYYEGLSSPYEAKDGSFELIDELLLVKGVSRDIFDEIKSFSTIYGDGQVNINTALKQVLMALGLEAMTVDKILAHRAGADRLEGTQDDLDFSQTPSITADLDKTIPPLALNEIAKLTNLIAAGKIKVSSSHFTVHSRATLNNGSATMDVEAVIDRTGKVYFSRSSGVQWRSKT